MIGDKDIEFMEEVAWYFRTTKDEETMPDGSIRDTALHFNLTRTKVQKILVTTGDYDTVQTREIKKLRDQGKSVKEIAEELGLSQATVSASLPYTDSFHGTSEPSDHTQAVRDYRAYEKAQAERMKGRKEEKAQAERMNAEGDEKPQVNGLKDKKEMKKVKAPEKLSRKTGEHILPGGLIRLHVELGWVHDEEEVRVLRELGGVKRGRTITRDIIAPKNMPLRALHFTLQRAFGFQESHLHRFEIFKDDLLALTGDKMENLLNLRGVIFTQTRIDGQDPFEPEYRGGSFKKWLKAQYSGPYSYYGDWLEEFHQQDGEDGNDLLSDETPDDEYYIATKLHLESDEEDSWYRSQAFPACMIDELEGTGENIKWAGDPRRFGGQKLVRCDANDPDARSIQKFRLGDMNLNDGLRAMNEYPSNLIERLKIGDVLALAGDYLPYNQKGKKIHTVTGLKHPQIVTKEQIQEAMKKGKDIGVKPFADMLLYIYDYGDNWHFRITGSKGCSDLVEDGVITKAELQKSIEKAQKEYHPVLVARDGDMLIEDCGNVPGFVSFLKRVNVRPEAVIEQENDFGDPDKYDGDWDDLDDEELDESGYKRLQQIVNATNGEAQTSGDDEGDEDEDWDDDRDENGMTRTELMNWALSQGWHRNDTSDINLL